MTTELPTWDEMSDLDQGAALMHLHKRDYEGISYAVENYPARYLDDERLVTLDGRAASRHAAQFRELTGELDSDEYERLYTLALNEPDRRCLWGARNETGWVVPVPTREQAIELITEHWPRNHAADLAMDKPPAGLNPACLSLDAPSKWRLLHRDAPGGEWSEVEFERAA
jgi:hypothetical protein